MAEQWITAFEAKRIAGHASLLRSRADVGLIRSRAKLLLHGTEQTDNVHLPNGFWCPEGEAHIEQNWDDGDFVIWNSDGPIMRAFGVTFALNDVLELLPPEDRSVTARELSVAGNPMWMPAREARRLACEIGELNADVAWDAIITEARLGMISARAVLAEGTKINSSKVEWEHCEWDVPQWFWENFTSVNSTTDLEKGLFFGDKTNDGDHLTIKLSGVYFSKASLEIFRRSDDLNGAQKARLPHKGGRPAAAFSDDLLCAIWGLIYQGDLKPTKQAEIERAMLSWAAKRGFSLSETSAREKARKVFGAMYMEVENPDH